MNRTPYLRSTLRRDERHIGRRDARKEQAPVAVVEEKFARAQLEQRTACDSVFVCFVRNRKRTINLTDREIKPKYNRCRKFEYLPSDHTSADTVAPYAIHTHKSEKFVTRTNVVVRKTAKQRHRCDDRIQTNLSTTSIVRVAIATSSGGQLCGDEGDDDDDDDIVTSIDGIVRT
jgi:hypothetical protein